MINDKKKKKEKNNPNLVHMSLHMLLKTFVLFFYSMFDIILIFFTY